MKPVAINSDAKVKTGLKAWSMGNWNPSIATKCVVQIAAPPATPDKMTHEVLASAESRCVRSNRRIVITAPATQTIAATITKE